VQAVEKTLDCPMISQAVPTSLTKKGRLYKPIALLASAMCFMQPVVSPFFMAAFD